MAGRLPKEILKRKKAGWHVPLGKWFQTDLKEYILDIILNSESLRSGIFNRGYIEKLLQDHFMLRRNNTFKIWGLLVFSLWYDIFIKNGRICLEGERNE